MDDEDDRHLLDILGDVDALNDYLHGSNSKSIEEDDVTNAAFGSDGTFFTDTADSNTGLKDGSSSMGEFEEDSSGAGIQLSFIGDELGTGSSPEGVDLGGEDQPFDILQKSLMEADITEQTLAQEALLDTQPTPTLVQAPVPFSSQVVPGGYGGGVGVATTATAAFQAGQLIQGVSTLSNGATQHIQVLGSFGASGGVMTLSNLERTPQIVLRPGLPVAPAGAGGQVFAPAQGQVGQVGLPLKNIPLQNIIIQRGVGGAQAVVRQIQPKPPQTAPQTVYNLGLQSTPTTIANALNANSAVPGGQYTANGSVVEQQPPQTQTSLQPGQLLLPNSLTLTPSNTIQNGSLNPCTSALLTSQNTVQITPGQNFSAPPGGQLVLNQGATSRSQVGGGVTQTWTGVSCASPAPTPTSSVAGRLTLIGPGLAGQSQASGCAVQRLLVTQTSNCTSLSPLPGSVNQEQNDFRQNCQSPGFKQAKLSSIHGIKNANDLVANSEERPILSLKKGDLILQQLRRDHAGVHTPDRRGFSSIEEALQRLLPYHAFQGAPPSQEDFSQVDEEFEEVASHVLMRTQAMVNKYRRLLMVEAERSSPSSELVMIDRTFNQEERNNLTQDKRMVLVDPDGFLEEFCCGMKSKHFQEPPACQPADSWVESDQGSLKLAYRTDPQPGCGDPGGGGSKCSPERLHLDSRKLSELKRPQLCSGSVTPSSYPQGKPAHFAAAAAASEGQSDTQTQHSPQLTPPPHPDSDSALEAAVNSILEC